MFANNTENLHYKLLHIICMETKRKTAYLCFLYFREWRDPIQNRRRKLSFTRLIEACFKFKYPASLNPRFTTILHLCAIEVVLKLSTKLKRITSGSHITSILQNSTIPDNKWSKFSFSPFKDVEEISLFRVISKWTPGSDASTETADQIRRLISFPVPLELRFGKTTISSKFFPQQFPPNFFSFSSNFFLFDEVKQETSVLISPEGEKLREKMN